MHGRLGGNPGLRRDAQLNRRTKVSNYDFAASHCPTVRSEGAKNEHLDAFSGRPSRRWEGYFSAASLEDLLGVMGPADYINRVFSSKRLFE